MFDKLTKAINSLSEVVMLNSERLVVVFRLALFLLALFGPTPVIPSSTNFLVTNFLVLVDPSLFSFLTGKRTSGMVTDQSQKIQSKALSATQHSPSNTRPLHYTQYPLQETGSQISVLDISYFPLNFSTLVS